MRVGRRWFRALTLWALTLCAVLLGVALVAAANDADSRNGAHHRSGSPPVRPARAVARLEQLPVAAQAPVSQVLGRAARSFWATRRGAMLVAHNRTQGLAAGDLVIVNNLQAVRDGTQVKAATAAAPAPAPNGTAPAPSGTTSGSNKPGDAQ